MRIGSFKRGASLGLVAVMASGGAGPAWADAADLYYERSFVLAAHARCDLFQPAVVSALRAARSEAHGSARRNGTGAPALDATHRRALAMAARTPCTDPDLARVRARVDQAHQGWSRLQRMTFKAGRTNWQADKTARTPTAWRLQQASMTGASPVVFGLAARPDGTTTPQVNVRFAGSPRPVAVRIVLRDSARAPRPVVMGLPPVSVRKTLWAAGRAASSATPGETWTFSSDVLETLARLDPREAFAVEFVFRDDSVARAVFTTGELQAARDFLGPAET